MDSNSSSSRAQPIPKPKRLVYELLRDGSVLIYESISGEIGDPPAMYLAKMPSTSRVVNDIILSPEAIKLYGTADTLFKVYPQLFETLDDVKKASSGAPLDLGFTPPPFSPFATLDPKYIEELKRQNPIEFDKRLVAPKEYEYEEDKVDEKEELDEFLFTHTESIYPFPELIISLLVALEQNPNFNALEKTWNGQCSFWQEAVHFPKQQLSQEDIKRIVTLIGSFKDLKPVRFAVADALKQRYVQELCFPTLSAEASLVNLYFTGAEQQTTNDSKLDLCISKQFMLLSQAQKFNKAFEVDYLFTKMDLNRCLIYVNTHKYAQDILAMNCHYCLEVNDQIVPAFTTAAEQFFAEESSDISYLFALFDSPLYQDDETMTIADPYSLMHYSAPGKECKKLYPMAEDGSFLKIESYRTFTENAHSVSVLKYFFTSLPPGNRMYAELSLLATHKFFMKPEPAILACNIAIPHSSTTSSDAQLFERGKKTLRSLLQNYMSLKQAITPHRTKHLAQPKSLLSLIHTAEEAENGTGSFGNKEEQQAYEEKQRDWHVASTPHRPITCYARMASVKAERIVRVAKRAVQHSDSALRFSKKLLAVLRAHSAHPSKKGLSKQKH